MIYAEKISFRRNDEQNLQTIVRIKLLSDSSETWKINDKPINGWYKKEDINAWLHNHGDTGFEIKVNIKPYPNLVPVERNSVKYVRSTRDYTNKDNLLNLEAFYEKKS